MSFLDSVRDKLMGMTQSDYEDDFAEEDFGGTGSIGSGLLGNTARPEADSISVYTRSGERISEGNHGSALNSASSAQFASDGTLASEPYKARIVEGAGEPRVRGRELNSSGQLPPYVMSPQAYEDVQMVFRRVKTSQPVVLNFLRTDNVVSRRILDFCFGFASGIGGSVDQLTQDVYVILPPGIFLTADDVDKLRHDGVVNR